MDCTLCPCHNARILVLGISTLRYDFSSSYRDSVIVMMIMMIIIVVVILVMMSYGKDHQTGHTV